MVRFFRSHFSSVSRRGSITALAISLLLGCLSGSLVAAHASLSGYCTVGFAAGNRVLLPSLFCVSVLPFLFTAAAAYIRRFWMLIPLAYMKSFLFCYFAACVLRLYGTSGWLVMSMLLFTDLFALPILCFLWIGIIIHGANNLFGRIFAAFLPVFIVAFLDYRYISPYLVNLLS